MFKLKDYNITVFGDSIAKGVVTSPDGKISRIENSAITILQRYFGKEVNNQSAFGQTLKRIYEKKYVEEYLSTIDKAENNCVVFALGGNDSDFNWKSVAEQPTKTHESSTSIKQFSRYLDILVKKLKKAGIKVMLVSLVPMDAKRFFDNIIGRQANKQVVLEFLRNDIFNIYRYQERFSMEIVYCAIRNNCELVDLRSELLRKRNFLNLLCQDGIHPNERGQKAIARVFIKSLC